MAWWTLPDHRNLVSQYVFLNHDWTEEQNDNATTVLSVESVGPDNETLIYIFISIKHWEIQNKLGKKEVNYKTQEQQIITEIKT